MEIILVIFCSLPLSSSPDKTAFSHEVNTHAINKSHNHLVVFILLPFSILNSAAKDKEKVNTSQVIRGSITLFNIIRKTFHYKLFLHNNL